MSSMYNQAAVEALCSATYLSNYLDSLENLPDDLQRNITQLREFDAQCGEIMGDIDTHVEIYQSNQSDAIGAKRIMLQVQRLLLRNQEIGDEKLNLIAEMIEFIENRKNQLEQDLENLDPQINEHEAEAFNPPVIRMNPTNNNNNNTARRDREPKKTTDKVVPVPDTCKEDQSGNRGEKVSQKRHRRKTNNHEATVVTVKEEEKKEEERPPKKKKKRKVKKDKDGFKPRIDPPIDPDEPTYCLCDQISYGEMIGCDNDGCEIEWFHFNCVNLTTKPKGKWYCPNCRGESSKVKRH